MPRHTIPSEAVPAILDGGLRTLDVPVPAGGRGPSVGDRIPLLEEWAAYWGARHPDGIPIHGFDIPQERGGTARALPEEPIHVHYRHGADPDRAIEWRDAGSMPDWAVRACLVVREVATVVRDPERAPEAATATISFDLLTRPGPEPMALDEPPAAP